MHNYSLGSFLTLTYRHFFLKKRLTMKVNLSWLQR